MAVQFPCPNPIACEGVDSPVQNLAAERADVRKCFGYAFFPDQTVTCNPTVVEVGGDCGTTTTTLLALQALCDPPAPPTNPQTPTIFIANAQSCTVICPDSSVVSYTVVAGSAIGLSQAEADQRAHDFACQVALILCGGSLPQFFFNTAQVCQFTCVDGTVVSFTTPANSFMALSVVEANALAFAFACAIVRLLCATPPNDLSIGSGEPPVPPVMPRFANGAQSCNEPCPDGSIFTFTARAGLFIRDTLAEANAVASSYACRQAELHRICLGELDDELCAGEFSAQLITVSGMVGETSWIISAGTIPIGMTFEEGQLAGIPTTGGAYSFTVTASDNFGNTVSKTYIVDVVEIMPSVFPHGTVSTVYSQQLTQSGGAVPETWGITAGFLPTGLTLDGTTGIIGGTPTVAGVYPFTASVITATGVQCDKDYTITIDSSCPDWSTLSWSAVYGGDTPPATVSFVPNPGSSASFNANATVPDFFGGIYPLTGGIATGSLMYNGGGCVCHIAIAWARTFADPAEVGGSITVNQNGGLIAVIPFAGTDPDGAYTLPFVLASTGGGNQLIEVIVDWSCNNIAGGGPATVSLIGTVSCP